MNTKINTTKFMQVISEYEREIMNTYNMFKGNMIGENQKLLINTDMNAFLFGLIADQSVKAELAWCLPYNLRERIGYFDIKKLYDDYDIDSLERVIKEKPALHRYPKNIAKYLLSACYLLMKKYDGYAYNIWCNRSAYEITKNLLEFKGISYKKAALGCLILARDFDIAIPDKYNIDIAYDIHIRRIFLRTGFVENDTLEEVTESAKVLNKEFPGRLTSSFWAIGREFCRPSNPDCKKCPIEGFCSKKIEFGVNLNV